MLKILVSITTLIPALGSAVATDQRNMGILEKAYANFTDPKGNMSLANLFSKDVQVTCSPACVQSDICYCDQPSLDFAGLNSMILSNGKKWSKRLQQWETQTLPGSMKDSQVYARGGDKVYAYFIVQTAPKKYAYLMDDITFNNEGKISAIVKLMVGTDLKPFKHEATLKRAYADFRTGKTNTSNLFSKKLEMICGKTCVESDVCWCDEPELNYTQLRAMLMKDQHTSEIDFAELKTQIKKHRSAHTISKVMLFSKGDTVYIYGSVEKKIRSKSAKSGFDYFLDVMKFDADGKVTKFEKYMMPRDENRRFLRALQSKKNDENNKESKPDPEQSVPDDDDKVCGEWSPSGSKNWGAGMESGSCCTLVLPKSSQSSCGCCKNGHKFTWVWKCPGSRRCK